MFLTKTVWTAGYSLLFLGPPGCVLTFSSSQLIALGIFIGEGLMHSTAVSGVAQPAYVYGWVWGVPEGRPSICDVPS